MHVVQFNFFNYFDNPIVQYCHNYLRQQLPNADFSIYTLDDVLPVIDKLNYSKLMLDANGKYNKIRKVSSVTNQLRQYFALQEDDFFYADGDVYMCDLETILKNKNCVSFEKCANKNTMNDGTFLYTDRNCRWLNYYFNLYQNNYKELTGLSNQGIFSKYPFELNDDFTKSGDMNILKTDNIHMFTSIFRTYAEYYSHMYTVYYSIDGKDVKKEKGKFIWNLNTKKPNLFLPGVCCFNLVNKYQDINELLNVFKEQLQYTVGHEIKFIEI